MDDCFDHFYSKLTDEEKKRIDRAVEVIFDNACRVLLTMAVHEQLLTLKKFNYRRLNRILQSAIASEEYQLCQRIINVIEEKLHLKALPKQLT